MFILNKFISIEVLISNPSNLKLIKFPFILLFVVLILGYKLIFIPFIKNSPLKFILILSGFGLFSVGFPFFSLFNVLEI